MKKEQYRILTTNNYTIRTETHQGKKHLIIPVVMMVEGVHAGSAGALLHTQEELSKFPASWDGIPVLIGHPEKNGSPISANSPGVIDQDVVGRVYNTGMENEKLKGEVWADVEKLKQISPLAYAYIMQQKPLDVSVGVFSDDAPVVGDWNGENYIAIAHNYRPDHLALLPEAAGACSWQDGCGIRVNEEGLLEKINLVRDKLYGSDTDTESYYLEEIYDDDFIYRKEIRGQDGKYYKREYQIKDGEVLFGSEIEEVIKEVKYKKILMQNNAGGTDMNNVETLLATAPLIYTKDDKEWLEKLEEVQVNKLLTCARKSVEALTALEIAEIERVKVNDQVTSLEVEIVDLKKGNPQINEEAAMKILKEKVSDIKTFAAMLPDELKGQFEYGQKLYGAHRQDLVAHIMANQAQEVWKEDDLNTQGTETLQKIADSIKSPASYEGGGGFTSHAEVEVLLPPGVKTEK